MIKDMGVLSSPARKRLRAGQRPIEGAFAVLVAGPAGGLLLLWLLIAALAGGGPAVVAAEGVIVVLAILGLATVFVRRLARDVTSFESQARRLANEQLPALIQHVHRGQRDTELESDVTAEPPFTAETASATMALASLQRTAMACAMGEADLRAGIRDVFVSLARRSQSLLQRQLRLIDRLEQDASDPQALADLFQLDHLTTRMRRHAEGLIILSGSVPGRSWSSPVPVVDVIRAAVAEIEDYQRVVVFTKAQDTIAGTAAADLTHLLAELIENGTMFSPSAMQVEVRADRVTNGFVIEIDDRGLGIKPSQLSMINDRLASPPDFDLADADQLGLFVVGRLAARHGVQVSLRPSPFGGTTAVVLVPPGVVLPPADPGPLALAGSNRSRATPEGALTAPDHEFRLGALGAGAPVLPASPVGTPTQPVRVPDPVAVPDPAGRPGPTTGIAAAYAGAAAAIIDPAVPTPGPTAASPGQASVSAAPDLPRRPEPGDDPGPSPTYRGLPRRVRPASRGTEPAQSPAGPSAPPPPPAARSPEETRDLVATLQRGWSRGRQAEEARQPAAGDPSGRATGALESEEI
jgi:signal transduction histidine kinase